MKPLKPILFSLLILFGLQQENLQSQNWSDPNTWGCASCFPNPTDDINLVGQNLVVDIDATIKSITDTTLFSSILTILPGVTLTVENSDDFGISRLKVENNGTLIIRNTASDGIYRGGITNNGTVQIGPGIGGQGFLSYCCSSESEYYDFINNGDFTITDVALNGIVSQQEFELQNHGTLNISEVDGAAISLNPSNSTNFPTEFYNYVGAEINIDQAGAININDASIGANFGTINISNTVGLTAINISGGWNNGFPSWHNETTGIINISNVQQGISVGGGETFRNAGLTYFAEDVTGGFTGSGKKINEGQINSRQRFLFGANYCNNGLITVGDPLLIDTIKMWVNNPFSVDFDSLTSVIELKINGTGIPGVDHDYFFLEEDWVNFGGTLKIILNEDYTPANGDCFDLINSAPSFVDPFDNVDLPDIAPLVWEYSYGNTFELCVVALDEDEDGFTSAIDCDDNNPNVNPDEDEIPYNGLDDDCDLDTRDDDLDSDGFLLAEDCDDNNAELNPDTNCDDGCDLTTDSFDEVACACVNTAPEVDDGCDLTSDSFDAANCIIVNAAPNVDDGCDLTDDSFDAINCQIINAEPSPDDGCALTTDSFDASNCAIVNIAPEVDDGCDLTNDSFDAANCVIVNEAPDVDDGCDLTDDSFDAANCAIVNETPDVNDDCDATADSFDAVNCLIVNTEPDCDDNDCETADSFDFENCVCVNTANFNCDDGCELTTDSFDEIACECVNTAPEVDDGCDLTSDSFDVATCVIVNEAPNVDDGCDLTTDSFDAANCQVINTEPSVDDGCELTTDSFDVDNCLIVNEAPEVDDGCDLTTDSFDATNCVIVNEAPSADDGCDLTTDSFDATNCTIVNAAPEVDDNCDLTADSFDTVNCLVINEEPNCDDANCGTADSFDSENCACINTENFDCDDACPLTIDSYDFDLCDCVNEAPSADDGCDLTSDSFDATNCVIVNEAPNVDDGCDLTADSFDATICAIVNAAPSVDDGCDLTTDSFDAANCTIVNLEPDCNDNNAQTEDTFDLSNCLCSNTVTSNCDDGCDLTTDFFDEELGECVNVPPSVDDACDTTIDSFDVTTCTIINEYPPCDDNDPCTANDQYIACDICEGTFLDEDLDTFCDPQDNCPGWDDSLLNTSCDDGDDCTSNDVYVNCEECAGIDESPDVDNDGLSECVELRIGTDPESADSDRDGILDGTEIDLGTDPLNRDTNSDGVIDGLEDEDGDGLTNGHEENIGSNPLSADSNGDGILDGDEEFAQGQSFDCGEIGFMAETVCGSANGNDYLIFISYSLPFSDQSFIITNNLTGETIWIEETGAFGIPNNAIGSGFSYTLSSNAFPNCSITHETELVECTTTEISLLSFTGKMEEKSNLLKWETASENECNYFILQRSENGIDFYDIAKADCQGNSNTLNSYKFNDEHWLNRESHYRLKELSVTGTATVVSNVVTLSREIANTELFIHPNPAKDIINFSGIERSAEPVTAIIYDITGRIVLRADLNANLPELELDISSISSGTYILTLKHKGYRTGVNRFVKL